MSKSLADKIAGILNTTPSSFDPEEYAVDATNAQIINEEVETNPKDEEILSKFRKANVDLLADLDIKYAGKKTSRRNLRDSDSEESELESQSSGDDNEDGKEASDSDDLSIEEEDVNVDDEEEEGTEDSDADDGESLEDVEETDPNFKHMSEMNVSKQIKKGFCVRNQMSMWENLLEVRIQLQKCLLTANKMPQMTKFAEIKKESGPEFSNKVNETKIKLRATLDKLLLLQKLLLKQFPETKNLEEKIFKNIADGDDEEIPSDTDSEESNTEESKPDSETSKARKRKLGDYEEELSEQHKRYKDYRNGVIQKWSDKTRVVVKGGATSHSVLEQLDYNLSNKDKLVKRTQMKRSQYTILGDEISEDKAEEEYNREIFDDDDFYHQLLRELIEVKSADVTDPVQLGRQWIQLQNMRSKMKRKIDTKATKGRKIRYAVHSKLVNFMAPIDENRWTDEAKNELYNSLFGKNQPVFNP